MDTDLEAKRARVAKIQAVQALMDSQGGPTPSEAPTDAAPAPDESTLGKLKRAAGTGLAAVGKAGAYLQGATVSPLVALGTEAATGKPVFNGEEYLRSLNPTNTESYPSPTEMLKRGGVEIPRGPKVSDVFPSVKDKWYDASAGGAADFALNTATDPATYLSVGLSAAAKGGKEAGTLAKLARAAGLADESGLTKMGSRVNLAVNPVESYMQSRAGKLYGKAFEDVDRVAAEQGKALKPSELLRESGFQGGAGEAEKRLEQINQQAGAASGHVLSEASKEGATVPLLETFKPAMEYASELRKKPYAEAAQLADQIDARIQYALEKSGGATSAAEANQLKSDLNGLIKDSGFAQGTEASLTNQSRRALSTDLGAGVRQSVGQVSPELGQELGKQWERYASTSPSVRDKLAQIAAQVQQKRGPFGFTAVDAMLLGGGVLGDKTGYEGAGNSALGALLLKKLHRGATSIEGRTLRGSVANRIGNAGGTVDTALRQGVWDNLKKTEKPNGQE